MTTDNIEAKYFTYGPSLTSAEYNVKMGDGNNKVLMSPIFNSEANIHKRVIDVIDDIILTKGLFSSIKIDFDEFDNVKCDSDDLIQIQIEGSTNLYYPPYNLILFHKKNWWKKRCLDVAFKTLYNFIPNSMQYQDNISLYSYHDLPKEIKFERSNKTIQEGYLLPNESMKIHKSKTRNDTIDEFYVRVNFTDEKLGESFKDVRLINILKNTPEIENVNFFFKLFEDVDETDVEKFETIKFYNIIMSKWIINVLKPTIDTFCDFHNINNNFYIHYL